MELLPRNAVWRTSKEIAGLLIYKNVWLISLGHVHYFHRGISFFTPSHPVHRLHTFAVHQL